MFCVIWKICSIPTIPFTSRWVSTMNPKGDWCFECKEVGVYMECAVWYECLTLDALVTGCSSICTYIHLKWDVDVELSRNSWHERKSFVSIKGSSVATSLWTLVVPHKDNRSLAYIKFVVLVIKSRHVKSLANISRYLNHQFLSNENFEIPYISFQKVL